MKAHSPSSRFRIRSLVAAIGMVSGGVHAAAFTVTNLDDTGPGSLRQAITDAEANNNSPTVDTITFTDGLKGIISLATDLPDIEEALSIAGGGAISVRGPSTGNPVFYIYSESAQSFSLSGMTISGNDGGAVSADISGGSSLTLDNMTITKNTGDSAVEVDGGSLTLTDSVISGNSTNSSGAGMYLRYTNFSIADSKIADNESMYEGSGGAMRIRWSEGTISRSLISGNSAGSSGGAISTRYGYLSIDNSQIKNNTSRYGSGGGISLSGYYGSLSIQSSSITGNSAGLASPYSEGSGGGVRMSTAVYGESSFSVVDSVVSGNKSAEDGGGLDVSARYVEISASKITDNVAGDDNGGFELRARNVTVSSSVISGNKAEDDRVIGQISVSYFGEGLLEDSTIKGHSSTSGDEALSLNGRYGTSTEIKNTTISGNTSVGPTLSVYGQSPVVFPYYSFGGSDFSMTNSTVSGNRSTGSATSVLVLGGSNNVSYSTFVDNSAALPKEFDGDTSQLAIQTTSYSEGQAVASISGNVLSSSNDNELQIGGPVFNQYEGFSYGSGDVEATLTNNVMTQGVAIGIGSFADGETPMQTDPELSPLGYRGGFTMVHEPKFGSPVIDAGNEGSRPDNRDQRGITGFQGSNRDFGSVEVVANTAPALVKALPAKLGGAVGRVIPDTDLLSLFVDAEGDTVTLVDVSGLPSGLSVVGSTVSGTLDTAGTYFVTLVVTDDNATPLQTVTQAEVTVSAGGGGSSSSGGSVPVGVLALLGFMAALRRRRD